MLLLLAADGLGSSCQPRPSIKRLPTTPTARPQADRQYCVVDTYLPATVSRRVPTDSRLTASRLAALRNRHHVAPFPNMFVFVCPYLCPCLLSGCRLCVPAPSIITNAVQPLLRWLPPTYRYVCTQAGPALHYLYYDPTQPQPWGTADPYVFTRVLYALRVPTGAGQGEMHCIISPCSPPSHQGLSVEP